VVAVAAGYNHSLALTRDGTVTGWGFNNAGQATGIPNTNFISVSADQVTIGGQLLNNVASIAAGRGYSMALKRDGTIVTWGCMLNDHYPPTVPAGLSNVIAIAAGDNFCLAITTNSAVANRFR
jgi:alpha-tubulin suppressor-like RCC1 family protein